MNYANYSPNIHDSFQDKVLAEVLTSTGTHTPLEFSF